MGLLDQETQVLNSDVYTDTVAAGAGMESPAAANQNLLFDLNALRSQISRILDPATPADWFQDMAAAGYDNFGIKQIHDKKLAFRSPITPGTNDFSIGVAEVHSVDTLADTAGSLNDTFWTLYETPEIAYYVWYNVNAAGVDPAPSAPGGVTTWTGVEVALATNDIANTVASNTQTQLQASLYDGVVGLVTNDLTLTNNVPGNVTDVADGSAATGFTFGTDVQGTDTTASGILVDSAKLVGGAGTIAVGAGSTDEGGYIAADEANFTVAGTLGVGLSQAADGDSILLNRVDIINHVTNETVEDAGSMIFGLLQTITGTGDGTSVAAAASENLQISFVKIAPGSDVTEAVTLPSGKYHFGLMRQRCFYSLPKGGLISGVQSLPDSITQSTDGTAVRLPFRHFDVTANAAASESFNIQTGVFSGTGTSTVFASYGTPTLPTTANEFRDDSRVKIWRNGNLQSKGAGKDVQWVSTTQLSFSKKVKNGDEIVIESLASF